MQQQQPNWGAQRPWYAAHYTNDPALVSQIQGWFYVVDTDKSGHLDQAELGRALTQAGITLTEATVKRLMQTFDSDRNGQIGVQEFVCLYQFVLFLRNAFSSQDHNRSGKLDTWTEISAALATAGFPLSMHAQSGLLGRFDPRQAGLTLDGFTDVALFLGGLKSYFDFYLYSGSAATPAAAYGHAGAPPGAAMTAPGVPGAAPGVLGAVHGAPGAPGVGAAPAATNITINFDQLVAATPYFV